MIQLDKAPYFPNQLRFNLDGSASTNDNHSLNSTPQLIFMQKLSRPSSITKNDLHRIAPSPMSDRMAFVTQIAKMDARGCLQRQKLVQKNVPAEPKSINTKVKQSNNGLKGPRFVKLHHPLRHNKPAKPSFSYTSPKKFKQSRAQQTLLKKQVTRVPQIPILYENCQYSHKPSTKDACVSTADLVMRQNHTSSYKEPLKSPIFRNKNNCICLIKKEKLDKSYSTSISSVSVSPKLEQQHRKIQPKKQRSDKKRRKAAKPVYTPAGQPIKSCLSKRSIKNTPSAMTDSFTTDEDDASISTRQSDKSSHAQLLKEKSLNAKSGNTISANEIDLMCNALHHQLLAMEDVENSIRSRWKKIKYDTVAENDPQKNDSNAEEVKFPIELRGGKTVAKTPEKKIVKFTKPKSMPQKKAPVRFPTQQYSSTLLSIPHSTADSIFKNKSKFNSYLHSVSHEPIGKFNPWKVVNELSAEIVNKIVSDVCEEVGEGFDDCVEHLFESEFAAP